MAEKILKDVKDIKIKKKAKAKTEKEENQKALEFSTLAKFLPIREVFGGDENPIWYHHRMSPFERWGKLEKAFMEYNSILKRQIQFVAEKKGSWKDFPAELIQRLTYLESPPDDDLLEKAISEQYRLRVTAKTREEERTRNRLTDSQLAMCDWRKQTFEYFSDSKGDWARIAVDGSNTSTENPKGSNDDPIHVPSADDEFEEFIAGDGTKEPSEQRQRLDEEQRLRRESVSSEDESDTDSVEGAVRAGPQTREQSDASDANDADAKSGSDSGSDTGSSESSEEGEVKGTTPTKTPVTPRPAPPAPPPPPFGSDSSESDSATDSDSDSSKQSKKRKAKAPSPTKRSVASSNSSAPIPTPAPATILSVASIATRQIPTVEALNTLTRASIDKFKLAIEALRRANDQTALDVFIPEPIQDLLTLKLFVTKQIKRDKAKYWKAWDDRKFFDVLQEVFPGDKRRSEDEYQTTLSRLNDVRLDIDFSLHDSELKYVSRVQKILIEAGGEKKFHRNQRQEFVKSMIRNIGSNLGSRYNDEVLRRLHQHLRAQQISRVKSLLFEILRWIEPAREHWTFGEECGWHKPRALVKETGNPKPNEPSAKDRPNRKRDKPTASPTRDPKPTDQRGECRGCGRKGHKASDCKGKDHPDWNKENCSFANSQAAKSLRDNNVKDDKGEILKVLPWGKRVDGTAYKGIQWDKPKEKKVKS